MFGLYLRLTTNRDQIGLAVLKDGFRLLGLQNEADRHRRDVCFPPNALGKGNLEAKTARNLRCCCSTSNPARGTVDHVNRARL